MPHQDTIKLCECGCGKPAPLSKENRPSRGLKRGVAKRFINGHHQLINGKTRLEWLREQLAISPLPDACMIWPFGKSNRQYGYLKVDGRQVSCHRVAFELIHGYRPPDNGCHICDTPPCFNPRHIFEGTQLDNKRDCVAKGRSARGERHARAKLTAAIAQQIREEYVCGSSTHGMGALARKYGVSSGAIWFVVNGVTWIHD